jgi:CRP-like cAMP-binding protein
LTAVETELERSLSSAVMQLRGKLPRRRVEPGETLVEQGAAEDDLFLLLDGVLDVEVDGKSVVQVGPGALLGERAAVEGGTRTATLRAVTPCRVVVLSSEQISKYELTELAGSHRREES